MIRWDDPALSGVFAAGFLGLLTLVWAALTLGAGRWGLRHRLQRACRDHLPMLSIGVPARDEAANIGASLRLPSHRPGRERWK